MREVLSVFLALMLLAMIALLLLSSPPGVIRAAVISFGIAALITLIVLNRQAAAVERNLARRHPDELLSRERRRVEEHLWLKLRAALERGRANQVPDYAAAIRRFSPDADLITSRSLCHALRRHGFFEEALKFLQDEEASGRAEPVDLAYIAFLSLQLGDVQAAKSVLARMKTQPLDVTVKPLWTCLMAWADIDTPSAYERDVPFFETLVERVSCSDPFIPAYTLSLAQERFGSVHRAIQPLRHYLTTEHARDWPAAREQALVRLATLYLSEGRRKEARATLLIAAKGRTQFSKQAREMFVSA